MRYQHSRAKNGVSNRYHGKDNVEQHRPDSEVLEQAIMVSVCLRIFSCNRYIDMSVDFMMLAIIYGPWNVGEWRISHGADWSLGMLRHQYRT